MRSSTIASIFQLPINLLAARQALRPSIARRLTGIIRRDGLNSSS
jgi:hypothetical protein